MTDQDPTAELRERIAAFWLGYHPRDLPVVTPGIQRLWENTLDKADRFIAEGFGDVAAERARAERAEIDSNLLRIRMGHMERDHAEELEALQARIDAAPHAISCVTGQVYPTAAQIIDGTWEEGACTCWKSAAPTAPEPPKLDPFPWVEAWSGAREAFKISPRFRFDPCPGYSRDREDYS